MIPSSQFSLFPSPGQRQYACDTPSESNEDRVAMILEELESYDHLHCVDLSGKDINGDEIELILELLKKCNVNEIDLYDNLIKDEGASTLSSLISASGDSWKVKRLYLGRNSIGPLGAISIGTMLGMNTSLETLSLSDNICDSSGADALTEGLISSFVHDVFFHSNQIGDRGAIAFGKMLTITDRLKTLVLDTNSISCDGASSLANGLRTNTSLATLSLADNHISQDGGIAIASMLMANKSLSSIDLSRNYLGASSGRIAEALCKNEALLVLKLGSNDIKDDCMVAFSKLILTNGTLAHLALDINEISDVGAAEIVSAFDSSFAKGRQVILNTMTLCYNHMSTVGTTKIASAAERSNVMVSVFGNGDASSNEEDEAKNH